MWIRGDGGAGDRLGFARGVGFARFARSAADGRGGSAGYCSLARGTSRLMTRNQVRVINSFSVGTPRHTLLTVQLSSLVERSL